MTAILMALALTPSSAFVGAAGAPPLALLHGSGNVPTVGPDGPFFTPAVAPAVVGGAEAPAPPPLPPFVFASSSLLSRLPHAAASIRSAQQTAKPRDFTGEKLPLS